jgi:hypothetical protein
MKNNSSELESHDKDVGKAYEAIGGSKKVVESFFRT